MLKKIIAMCCVGTCAACLSFVPTSLKGRQIEVENHQSRTVYLETILPEERTVFVQVHDLTVVPMDFNRLLSNSLEDKGYTLLDDPAKAHFLLQVRFHHLGLSDNRAAQSALNSGFGSEVEIQHVTPPSEDEFATFAAIADIQITEQIKRHELTKESRQGIVTDEPSMQLPKVNTDVRWRRYKTRMVSTATRVNLDAGQAVPALERSLTKAITSIF